MMLMIVTYIYTLLFLYYIFFYYVPELIDTIIEEHRKIYDTINEIKTDAYNLYINLRNNSFNISNVKNIFSLIFTIFTECCIVFVFIGIFWMPLFTDTIDTTIREKYFSFCKFLYYRKAKNIKYKYYAGINLPNVLNDIVITYIPSTVLPIDTYLNNLHNKYLSLDSFNWNKWNTHSKLMCLMSVTNYVNCFNLFAYFFAGQYHNVLYYDVNEPKRLTIFFSFLSFFTTFLYIGYVISVFVKYVNVSYFIQIK